MVDKLLSWLRNAVNVLIGKPAVQAALLQIAVSLAAYFGLGLSAPEIAALAAALAAVLGSWVHVKTRVQIKKAAAK